MKAKKLILALLFCSLSFQLISQSTGYHITFNQIFDNREYFSEYAFHQTIFGARLDASLDFTIDTIHSFYTGFSYLYEHGSYLFGLNPSLILYYDYTSPKLNMAFGAFPRKDRLDMPLVFLNDTLNYYRPNVEGAYISYSGKWGNLDGFIDWTGRVSESRRETFLVGVNSHLKANSLFLESSFLMYHNAKSYSPLDSIPLQDNGILSLIAGYESENDPELLNFSASGGLVASFNRYRPEEFSWARGLLVNIKLLYTIFGLKGVYYFGTPLDFIYTDPFYRSGNYGRVDLFVDPFGNPKVQSKIAWNVHLVPGEGIHHSQQILISVTF